MHRTGARAHDCWLNPIQQNTARCFMSPSHYNILECIVSRCYSKIDLARYDQPEANG